MKKIFVFCCFILTGNIIILQFGCNSNSPAKQSIESEKKEMSHADMITRGKYLVSVIGCTDCHSPKIMTPQGPVPDSTKFLSGHPANSALPPVDKSALKPGYWILFSADLTAAIGPWGISYSANLTPDTTTGLGAWTEDVFIKTLRTGKHLGQDGGRQILPPMPWEDLRKITDEDMKAIFAYLKELPPIVNKVPSPVVPPDVEKMKY